MIKTKKITGILLLMIVVSGLQAQTVGFNFSATSQPVSGWINVWGNPSAAVRTATDPTTGITISSVATANWVPVNDTLTAYDGSGEAGGTFFPAAVMLNHWFQDNPYVASYNAAVPQLEITGLNIDSVYTLKMAGSGWYTGYDLNPTQYTVTGAIVYGYIDVNNNQNTANGATFTNVAPDATGMIRVYVNPVLGSQGADICGITITRGRTAVPTPVVSITHPFNSDIIAEDGNVSISATAIEAGGSISRVEFYADTTLIGVDSSAPYNITWLNPDAGPYTLTARAIDPLGNTNTASVSVTVDPLSSFWSMTGNINMNADSNFVGNVDSVRLAFRTKNLERMSISPTGNVGIGVKTPTAQLHTTGTVRFSGMTSDSTKTRVLVSDTSGNLFYRNVSSLSGRWQYVTGTQYDSSDNIGIGTSNTQGYKLAVNGTGIFTKVKVKPLANWPDYVFKKDYHLPDLAELELYISTHHHLPGIIAEADQSREGLDLGENQSNLLKKIEELTLYLIGENQRLKEQNKRMEQLNSQSQQLSSQTQQLEMKLRQQQQEIEELKKLIRDNK